MFITINFRLLRQLLRLFLSLSTFHVFDNRIFSEGKILFTFNTAELHFFCTSIFFSLACTDLEILNFEIHLKC